MEETLGRSSSCHNKSVAKSYTLMNIMADDVSQGVEKTLKLEWLSDESLPTLYANQAIISHASGDEFYLILGEASVPPSILIDQIDTVSVRPVARIAFSPGSMMRIANAITTNVNTFLERHAVKQEADKDANPD